MSVKLSMMEYANDEWCRCRPKMTQRIFISVWTALPTPPKKGGIICHTVRYTMTLRWVVESAESCSMGNYRWRWQWSITVCACENFVLVFAQHWPTVCGGIALCAWLWRQWRRVDNDNNERWECMTPTRTPTLPPAQTQQRPVATGQTQWGSGAPTRTLAHTDHDSCARRWRPAKSGSENKRQLENKYACRRVCVCVQLTVQIFDKTDRRCCCWRWRWRLWFIWR